MPGAEGHHPPRGSGHRAVTVPPQEQDQEQEMREFSCCWDWERQQEEGSELGVPFCGALMVEQSGRHPRKERPGKVPSAQPSLT